MAKRKRKRRSVAVQLKYEVYGILLITLSVIALSGEATVGRSLSSLFGLMLGKFYFVLALVGIYVGLVVMVKRAWPKGWSSRKSGILLFVLGLTLWSAIAEIDLKLVPTGAQLSGADILYQLGSDIRGELFGMANVDRPMMDRAISGGYAGAVQYAILFTLFGYFGAKFVLVVMFAIALMLVTGKSYVDLLRGTRKKLARLFTLLRLKLKAARRPSSPKGTRRPPAAADYAVEDDDEEDEENERRVHREQHHVHGEHQVHRVDGEADVHSGVTADDSNNAKRKKPLFFSWFQSRDKKSSDEQDAEPVWAEEPPAPWESANDSKAPVNPAALSDALVGTLEGEAQGGQQSLFAIATDAVDPAAALDGTGTGTGLTDEAEALDNRNASGAGGVIDASEADAIGAAGATGAVAHGQAEKPYTLPSLALLAKPGGGIGGRPGDLQEARRKLEATLESFGVRATVLDVVRGPAVTRYEVQPASGVKVSRIVGLTDDIALALAAKDVRMEAPIPGKSAIGIEVPNMEVSVVTMREVMETTAFQHAPSKLSIAFGRDISGQPIVGNLARMPHLLVAGATGSGKSVCINGIITSILYKALPDEVRFLMIDPKMVELNVYNGIPHLLAPVVTDPRRASLALKKIVVEMEKRYELFSKSSTRNIEGYNTLVKDNPAAVLPYIVVIVDELADLMMVAAGDVEEAITRLAQMARAAGIHLIIATQRPSVDVITGVIKANIPSRIAFGVSSQVDSRTILDMAGAEKLLGRGDMLFLPVGMSKPIRVQGAFLSDQEVEAVVHHVSGQGETDYKEDLVPELAEAGQPEEGQLDELFDQAAQIVIEAKQASVSLLQRRMRVGYTRAARLVDQLEAKGIVGPYEGSKPRDVLLTMEQFQGGGSSGRITS